jgi:hypothetical protein
MLVNAGKRSQYIKNEGVLYESKLIATVKDADSNIIGLIQAP